MRKVRTVYSLKELHKLLEQFDQNEKKNLFIYFDIDLTIVMPHPNNEDIDILIEEDVTKELFAYIMKHKIYFALITARFFDTVCNCKKRDLDEMENNVTTTIYPFLEKLGLDVSIYKDKELNNKIHLIKNENDKTVGAIYKGIIFGGKKGEIIKNYRKEFGFDKTHPLTVFIDDYEPYIRNVVKHVPDAIILRREIN